MWMLPAFLVHSVFEYRCPLFVLAHLSDLFIAVIFAADMSSTAFIEPLPVIDFVMQLLNRDVTSRPLSDSDRVKVSLICFSIVFAL